jgi:two-component system response regulator HydG
VATASPTHQPTLLVVDDDEAVRGIVSAFARRAGFAVVCCGGGAEALAHLEHHRADVAAVDLRMPQIGGLEVLKAIRGADPDCQVILMSGDTTIASAVEAIKLGAMDYLPKPLDLKRLRDLLDTVNDDALRRRRLLDAEREVASSSEFAGMIGRGPLMQELFGFIRRLAPHVRTALITGETGTGKELVARALHSEGPRRAKPFVTINCSAVVEGLFESELFGHVRGAFTGASAEKAGLFEAADGGTLFLDEVGELPLALQAKLLRVLESGELQRVGAVQPRRVDVHVLAATNRGLREEIAAGGFRADLLYRLNVVELIVPPLRERREDIPYLTAAFVRDLSGRLGKRLVGPTPQAERSLVSAPWKGNVRELRNVIERACILADTEFITDRELIGTREDVVEPRTPAPSSDALSSREREHIEAVLARVGGNKLAAAKVLGLSRWALYRRLEQYGITTRSEARRGRPPTR